jgi:hypothetical protein
VQGEARWNRREGGQEESGELTGPKKYTCYKDVNDTDLFCVETGYLNIEMVRDLRNSVRKAACICRRSTAKKPRSSVLRNRVPINIIVVAKFRKQNPLCFSEFILVPSEYAKIHQIFSRPHITKPGT